MGRLSIGMGVGRGVIVGVERRTLPSVAYCAIRGGGSDASRGGSTQYVDGDTPANDGSSVEGPGVTLGVAPGERRLTFGDFECPGRKLAGMSVACAGAGGGPAAFAFAIKLKNGFRGFCVGDVNFARPADGGVFGRG